MSFEEYIKFSKRYRVRRSSDPGVKKKKKKESIFTLYSPYSKLPDGSFLPPCLLTTFYWYKIIYFSFFICLLNSFSFFKFWLNSISLVKASSNFSLPCATLIFVIFTVTFTMADMLDSPAEITKCGGVCTNHS